MRTDDFGREIAPANSKPSPFRGSRLFVIGMAVGVGLCVGMGPPLPLIDQPIPAALATEPAPHARHQLPRHWLVLRDALIDTSVTGASVEEQKADIRLLHDRWAALIGVLQGVSATER